MDREILKKSLKELRQELIGAQARVMSIKSAIEGLCDMCTHEWMYSGHGHNYDIFTCNICGKEEDR